MFETMVTVTGIVVGDVSQRRYGDNVCLAQFRLMTKERKYVRESDEWVDGDRMFLSVRCWRQLGENVLVSLKRGDRILVTGRLYHREFESEGRQRLSVEIDARAVGPDLSFCTTTAQRQWSDTVALAVAA